MAAAALAWLPPASTPAGAQETTVAEALEYLRLEELPGAAKWRWSSPKALGRHALPPRLRPAGAGVRGRDLRCPVHHLAGGSGARPGLRARRVRAERAAPALPLRPPRGGGIAPYNGGPVAPKRLPGEPGQPRLFLGPPWAIRGLKALQGPSMDVLGGMAPPGKREPRAAGMESPPSRVPYPSPPVSCSGSVVRLTTV